MYYYFKKSQKIKKGIVLKCQGNPVSCYGKRSAPTFEEPLQQQQQSQENQIDASLDSVSDDRLENSFENTFEKLISACKQGNTKGCNMILKIMLMNSD